MPGLIRLSRFHSRMLVVTVSVAAKLGASFAAIDSHYIQSCPDSACLWTNWPRSGTANEYRPCLFL